MGNKLIGEVALTNYAISSEFLKREVTVDFFEPVFLNNEKGVSLLLINDGQDMEKLRLEAILNGLFQQEKISPLLCVGIHCGADRRNEYGTASVKDYKGRGAKAGWYTRFVISELLPFIYTQTGIHNFKEIAYAGFSLGGLSALDIVWNHPKVFSKVGVFSGSLWWRTKALDDGYVEARDRIMHAQIRNGAYYPGLKFFFETGTLDETDDRNNNGIIDSIDDTLGLIAELEHKGYKPNKDIEYLELKDGKHDVITWGRAMPVFLKWGWGK